MKHRMYFTPFRAEKERNKKLYYINENAAVVYTVTIIGEDLKILSLSKLGQESRLQDKENNSFTVSFSPQQFYESMAGVKGGSRNNRHS